MIIPGKKWEWCMTKWIRLQKSVVIGNPWLSHEDELLISLIP